MLTSDIQCDLLLEGCGQCRRAKLLCHGFRGSLELAFRDETHATKQKVLARQEFTHSAEPSTLQLGWDVRSRQAFFCIYVTRLSSSFDSLIQLYAHASAFDSLSASIDAVSLAFMSVQLNSSEILNLAKRKYVIAIHNLAKALQNPSISARDDTLQTVLLLDHYEKLVNRNLRSPTSWMSHIQGAMALVKARGLGFSSPIACELTIRMAFTLTVSCGAAICPIPDELTTLWKSLGCIVKGAKWDFISLLMDVVNLRANIHNGTFACAADAADRAREIEDQLILVANKTNRSFNTRRVYFVEDHPLVFDHHYDLYLDHAVDHFCDSIRTIRLEMNNIMRICDPGYTSDLATRTSKAISELTQETCAMVPQFILPEARSENGMPFSPLQKLQCCILLAPLFLANQLSDNDRMRDWIWHIMKYMVEVGKMKIAQDVIDILIARPDTDHWKIFVMTGSYAIAA